MEISHSLLLLLLLVTCSLHTVQSQFIQFSPSSYFQRFQEEQPVNTTVITVCVGAFNSFGQAVSGSFSIPTSGDGRFFSIEYTGLDSGVNNAVIRSSVIFDWDVENVQTQYSFPVTFMSSVGGASRDAQVTVFIEDINDNIPRFTRDIFQVSLFEEFPSGIGFLNVTAVDPDQVIFEEVVVDRGNNIRDVVGMYTVDNGRIIYNITAGNNLSHFQINPDNGSLSISAGVRIDIDQVAFYNLTVMATDGGGQSDITTVEITILDSNDNAPQIMSPRGVDVTISEDTPSGYVILEEINATDLDTGANADIQFSIASGDLTGSFSIDRTTGRIVVSAPLDREVQGVLNLTVVARDQGVPSSLQDAIYVVVRLLDVNDYTPQFMQTEYVAHISENSRVGSSVARIIAMDLDEGDNGRVTYNVVQGGDGNFMIDPSTGDLFTNVLLDRENVSSYDLIVGAVDNPLNLSNQLSSEVNVTVLVNDINDNNPIFSQESYQVSILDNVTRLQPLIQLTATDRDSGPNGQITYRIEVPDPTYPTAFRIDAVTGTVFRNRRLSFENQSHFTYTIRALDNGPLRFSDDVPLTIILHNVNENPPVFAAPFYNSTIIETTPLNEVVLNVSASDRDIGAIGEVRYRIVTEFDKAGSFAVNDTTGAISVNSTLDFDFRDSIFFVVEAYDGGFPEPFTDRVNVTVCLIGTNDEAPSIIFPQGFQLFVPENTPPEVDVVTLRDYTIDPDLDQGGEFTFSLTQVYDPYSVNESFSLNETTGLLRSLRVFDRELQPSGITVAIETVDFEGLSRVTNITVMIMDKNDNSPYFEDNVTTTVHEFLPPGQMVLNEFQALDEDIGSNADLRYALFDGEGHQMFSINRTSGGLFTAAVLNKTIQDSYNLTVMVVDQGIPQLFGFGTIYVQILDSNDMVPTFSQSLYTPSFSESDPIGTSFFRLNASDSDIGTNAEIQYYFAPNSSNSDRFTINSTTGELFTDDRFDREMESMVELTVIAVDNGLVPHPLTGSATVMVTVEDFNEHPPLFNETSYNATVIENADIGTFVAAALASDEDAEPPNNLIRYSLQGNRSDAFSVDPVTGVVTVFGEVDWEEGGEFNVTIVASDLGASNTSLSSTVELMITILDVNDNPPLFLPESLNLTIKENSVITNETVLVGSVQSNDADSPGNNSDITYSVLMDFSNQKFTLNYETGEVFFARGTLNRERRSSYDLLIRATDHGSPVAMHTDATLTITVLDANDFDPVFDQVLYSTSIPERTEIGTPFLTLRATDADSGSNADLRYHVADSAVLTAFGVNMTSGIIYVASILDFESVTFYSFEVIVTDLGTPSRNASTRVEIAVTDSNDFPPVFNQSEYLASIRENLASGTTVVRVLASDGDTNGENTNIVFSLLENQGSEKFGINNETGVVYTNAYLNREESSLYNLTIIANNSLALYPLTTSVQLLVTITDLNDMHPTFNLLIRVPIFENVTVGSVLHTFRAEDGDEGANGTIEYRLLEPSSLFDLNSTTGDLTLLETLDYESSQRLYMLPVVATDFGDMRLSNYTNVLIEVMDSNDSPPRFASPEYSVTIDSEVAAGSIVTRVAVDDADQGSNAGFMLSFLSGNSLNLFEVGGDGTIRTRASLRPHRGGAFVLTLQASESMFSDMANVTVFIQRGAASLPHFNSRNYDVTLSEAAQNGDIVMEFSGRAQNVDIYRVNSAIFDISSTGTLTVANSSAIDFETQSLYQLTISIENTASITSAYAILNIRLTDENEHTPLFISNSSFVGVPETLAVGEVFFTAIAADRDGDAPANVITYDISQSDPLARSYFRINSATGELSLTRTLSYEDGNRGFNLTIQATNSLATPRYSSTARLEIEVLNGNTFDPVFGEVLYTIRLREDFPAGMNIINVSATDRDYGSHGEVTFGVHGNHRYLDFSIDTYTGQIFTNAPLDYERTQFYTLNVIASDGGNPARSVTVPVEILIIDLNDNSPIWNREIYTINIVENTTVNSIVVQVNATDADQDESIVDSNGNLIIDRNSNGRVTYSITAGDPSGSFGIDRDTGAVSVASSLDREVYPEYNLTLNATDGGGLFANAYLHVVIHDINDKIPTFVENPYSIGLSEDAPEGTVVVTVRANDTDLNRNSEIRYFFQDSPFEFHDSSGTFFLNDSTGEVTLEVAIDREDIALYNITVLAMDMGDTPLTGRTQLLINVLDINEFPPEFTQSDLAGQVFENEPIGTIVLQISSTDLDFGENSTVLYSIIGGDNDTFAIEAASGNITVAGVIDYEVIEEYDLVIMATDAGPAAERLVNTTNVTITILDRNDNPPIFSEPFYVTSIPEDSVPGDVVLNVNASDADSGSNQELVFRLEFMSNESKMNFVIDEGTGILTLSNTSNLDRERTSTYDITVSVADEGSPSLMSSVPISIGISDANDNAPQFTIPFFQGSIHENLPPLTSVLNVSATDADIGANAEIHFSITKVVAAAETCVSRNGSVNETGCITLLNDTSIMEESDIPFAINDSQSGEISLLRALDRENVSVYLLEVTATDSGELLELTNTTFAIIKVLDQNDETPTFSQDVYLVNISEYSVSGQLVGRVDAVDFDLSSNAEITYSLSGLGMFTINMISGEIFALSASFNRESEDLYNLTVMATDAGTPSLTSSALVMVTILDENDSPPTFAEPRYTASIRENLPLGSVVVQLNASDADIGSNAELTYSIYSSSPAFHFEIDPVLGTVLTTQPLDRERFESYTITIFARDGGSPALTGTTLLEVIVIDENDFPPSFINSPYAVSVAENTASNLSLLSIVTFDPDLNSNAQVFYSIQVVSPSNAGFEINRTSGEFFLRLPLDAEVSEVYNVTVRADNGAAFPFQASDTVVRVTVRDSNDNSPSFGQVDYIIPYLESNPMGSVVIEITAFDADVTNQNSALDFEITGGFNTSLFNISTGAGGVGVVSVAGLLDRENEPQHVLEVTVTDSGSPPLNATTTLTVILLDSNDNSPIFEQSIYTFDLTENLPISTLVGQIQANDIDVQNVTYYLNGTNLFEIDSITGEIFTSAEFDREEQAFHSIVAVATDGGLLVERSAEVIVNVTILDVNDVVPSFSNSTYTIFLFENTSTSSIILRVEAADYDFAENGSFFYSILPGNDSSFFSINRTTGDISLEQELDRETQDFLEISIAAGDLGDPSLTGVALVIVSVLDNNDNIPVLNSSNYTAVIPEDTPTGSTLIYIGASDRDINHNANITFSLSDTFGGTFAVGERDGVLSLTKTLDYESAQSYRLFVSAQDDGSRSLSSSSEVFIEVVDLNDNPPLFNSSTYSVSIPENAILGTEIFQIPATDVDSTSNGELRYSILFGNLRSVFSVDEVFGKISVSDYLDREIVSFYRLGLRAVDQGTPQFTATAELEVSILDVNDHSPMFSSSVYSVSVPELTPIGTSIYQFTASDLDIGNNANLSYSILSGDIDGLFEIGSESGELVIAGRLDAERVPSHSLSMLVSDNGSPYPLVDTATIRVTVSDQDEHAPSFPLSTYYINISQNAVVGSLIGRFVATDRDVSSQSSSLTYRLVDGMFYFEVDPLEGTVYVLRPLTPGMFMLSLEVTDGSFSTSVDIYITVVPFMVTMTTPLFSSSSYHFEVSEMAEIGTVIGQVVPQEAAIFNNTQGLFTIDSDGNVVVASNLDYESAPVHVLNIVSPGGMNTPPIYVVMTISVLDANDNPPVFDSEEYRVTVSESIPLGTTLTLLHAFDIDQPGNDSDFIISLSDQESNFNLDPSTGILSTSGLLDYEANSSHILTVVATNNMATPALSSSARVIVSLIDENDNSPQFSQMFYRISIPESTPIGTNILTLQASDSDSGTNSELVFAITYLSEPLTFSINQSSGVISTNTTYDYLDTASYIVSASVADRGNPQPLAASTSIFVEISPHNLGPPVFSQPEGYNVTIPETLAIGASILQVSASDTSTGAIIYSIASGNVNGLFTIDPSEGLVTLAAMLDFDVEAFHVLTVQAEDSGTPPQTAMTTLNVTVLDVNNHDPQFELRAYRVSVFENVTMGTSIIQVVATDIDSDNITYQITTNYYVQEQPSFSIDPVTGVVSTIASIDREMAGVIQLLVSAIDSGYRIRRSNSIPVFVTVLDLNDNPPVFQQPEVRFGALRLLTAGKPVIRVIATDADLVGDVMMYSITADNSSGLFRIDPITGVIVTNRQIDENTSGYQVNVTAFDGSFTTPVTVNLPPVNDGDFCEDDGFCRSIREVNCTFDIFPFVECNPFCISPYNLSSARRVCVDYRCLNSTLVPCIAMETCLPVNLACAGTCLEGGMSVCPTTNLCYMTTLSESCDNTNVTCLIGQSLVQRNDTTRYCAVTNTLPQNGRLCNSDSVYCEELDRCMNRSSPYLCQRCPGQLLPCPNSGDCVTNLVQCCSPDEAFCSTLNSCLQLGTRCELPNIAPSVPSELVYLKTMTAFNESAIYSSEGHVISVLLGNNGTNPAVDSQGEEVSVAIVGASDVTISYGEWQFALTPYENWMRINRSLLSESNALLLPNTARLRFVRKSIELDGAVWLRARLWDGNTDGFLSPRQDLVQRHSPSFMSTLPYTPSGAFSQAATLLTVIISPAILPPSFNPMATLQFTRIQEDVVFAQNLGNALFDLILSVEIPNFSVLSEDRIEGFPQGMSSVYEQLLPAEVTSLYYDNIRRVNPTRKERQLAHQSGQLPGVAVSLDSMTTNNSGLWQVALSDDPKLFLSLDSIISSTDMILLNTTARLRFLPHPDSCGVVSILLAPWDGFWNSTVATQLPSGFIISNAPQSNQLSSSQLSMYNLNSWERAQLAIECLPDRPRVLERLVHLSPIPYRIIHWYERVFSLLVDRNPSSLRQEELIFANYLQIILQHSVSLLRFSPATERRTEVSFSVQNDVLNFETVSQLISQRRGPLSLLNFNVLNISQDTSFGPGAGCPGATASRYHGDHVSSLVGRFASDGEGDFLGLAVVGVSTTPRGVWQYHRGNWTVSENRSLEYDLNINIWVNFPSQLTISSALLLHGNDRIRFLPHPDYFWVDESPPTISVKVWDNTVGPFSSDLSPPSEASTMNINTDPLVDTLQSINQPIGLFSSDLVTLQAARYGCDGMVNSGVAQDQCCVCGGDGASCVGCDGVRGSNRGHDPCDVCGGPSSCIGCDLIPFSGTELQQCGACLSQISVPSTNSENANSSFVDCNGDCFGTALIDSCGVCSGGRTSHDFNTDLDCNGMCRGNAVMDTCGYCTGPGTSSPLFNQNLDCTGVCNGSFRTDSCGVCQLPSQNGSVHENRDCSGQCFGAAMLDSCGECYGGSTNVTEDSTLDSCGVCNGDNSTCVGCDGEVASGKTIDRCGECGGNNCGCFLLDALTPQGGPISGGTMITVWGAGFFLNDTALLGFDFNPNSPNCGAPTRFLNQSSIRITCRLTSGNRQFHVPAIPVDQGTITCTSQTSISPGAFDLQVSVSNGPFSNPVRYVYDDYSLITLNSLSPMEWELNSQPVISFVGEGFINASSSACLIYDSHTCTSPPSPRTPSEYISVPSIYVSSSEVRCVLPPAATSCRVTVRLSLDGQRSGQVQSESTDFIFTYRFSAPNVTNIDFSDDLSSLVIRFDRAVRTNFTSFQPSCAGIFDERTFDLIGGFQAICSWSDNRQRSVTITLPASANVKINSPITFRDGAILTRNTVYSFSVSNTTVSVSPDSIQPVAIINGPSSIPACGRVSFSGLHSQYPGYGGFEYNWSILVQDSTIQYFSDIVQYLNSRDANSSEISLNSSLFLPNVSYYVQLFVTNSIGLRSRAETIHLLKDSIPKLQVSILGSTNRILDADEDLVVQSLITRPDCSEDAPLQFEWGLVRITDKRRNVTTRVDLSTVKTSSHLISIPADILMENASYTLHLSVTSPGRSSESMNTSLQVQTLPSRLRARIHGGNRTVSITSNLVFDARNSTYSSRLAPPTFTWICSVVGSLDACYNQSVSSLIPVPIKLPNSDFITFPSSILTFGRSYMFRLRMEQGSLMSEDTVIVRVENSSLPKVELSSHFSDLSLSQEISLFGFVYSSAPIQNVQWESVQLEGQGFVNLSDSRVVKSQTSYAPFNLPPTLGLSTTTIPLAAAVSSNIVNRVSLILSPHVLEPRLAYTFRLTATNSAGTSYAERTLVPNPPPSSAQLTSEPTSGVALETEFELRVSGALDSRSDSPFLYQFGLLRSNSSASVGVGSTVPPESIQWMSGVQTSPIFCSVFPSGDRGSDHTYGVFARVFDRTGGYSDVTTEITVLPNLSMSNGFYANYISTLQNDLVATRNWNNALSRLVTYLHEINANASSSISQSTKEQSLQVFLSIFNNHLPPSPTHYILASSILSLITSSPEGLDITSQMSISMTSLEIANWFKNETAIMSSFLSIPMQDSGEPLFLQSGYVSPEKEFLSIMDASVVLSPWIQLVESGVTTDSGVAEMFLRGVESVTNVLCQQSSTGEEPSLLNSSLIDVYVISAPPLGPFNISNHLVDFRSSVIDIYQSQACPEGGVACSEACVTGVTFPLDLARLTQSPGVGQTLQLSDSVQQKIMNEIRGSNPLGIELFSDIVSISISIPFQNLYLNIQNLNSSIQVLIPVTRPLPSNKSIPLCLYREVGGASGYGNYDWLLDNTTAPSRVEIKSTLYYSCEFNHLSDFAIGLLPPPVITDPPPTTIPETTPTTITTMPTTPTTRATTSPVSTEPVAPSPAGPIAAVIIIFLVIVVVVIVVIVIVYIYWRKKKKKMKVAPDESAMNEDKSDPELVRAGPLTPAESKIPMDIICLEEGKRTRLGKMNILPSIRLRELRFEIIESFPNLKNKPFYFLTRQLCDIEPTTEQQQFVSIVFGSKPIFIREVTADNLQTKKHFCVCGNAAQFECSNCSSQGYCGQECQTKHWVERHQKECSRLSEKKRRTEVLYSRQNTAANFTLALSPISETPQRAPLGPTSPTSPVATTPADWKSFMNKNKLSPERNPFPPRTRSLSVPVKSPTTLGSLTKRFSVAPDQSQTPIQAPPSAPGTLPRQTSLGPKQRVPSPLSSGTPHGAPVVLPPLHIPTRTTLPPSTQTELQSPLGQSTSQPLFTRPPAPVRLVPPPPVRQLSIQSVGSADFALSPQATSPAGIRSEPILESNEEDYESSDSGSSTGSEEEDKIPSSRRSVSSSGSRPPSLAVRRKKSRISESSSSSSDEESSSDNDH